jgi:ClpP class serine protease
MDRLDQTYGLFIAAVGKGRPQLSAEMIREMQSRVYKSAQAQKLGLIDHVMGRDEYIDYIKQQTRGAVTVPVKGVRAMNIDELRAQHPDLVSQVEAAAREGMISRAEHDTALTVASTEATETSRSSVLALHSAIFGEEAAARFSAAVESGITADQAKALGITAETGDAASRTAILDGITAAAAQGLRPGQIVQQQVAAIDTSAIYANRQAR